jgi:anti-anti-sigma factor
VRVALFTRTTLTAIDGTYFHIDHVAMEDGAAVIALRGELDAASSRELRSMLGLLGLVFGAVVIDLSGVVFCDSRGLGVLRGAHDQLRATHGRLTLRRPSPTMQRLFAVTGLDGVLDIDPCVVEEADPIG